MVDPPEKERIATNAFDHCLLHYFIPERTKFDLKARNSPLYVKFGN
jgi:hypothetical protein